MEDTKRDRATPRPTSAIGRIVLFHSACFLAAAVFFVGAFHLPLATGSDTYFFHGLRLLAGAVALQAAGAALYYQRGGWRFLRRRDIIQGASVNFCLLALYFTHVPVTADRSVTVFLLGALSEAPAHQATAAELEATFIERYVRDDRAIGRRIDEQLALGTLERVGNEVRLTARGEGLIHHYSMIGPIFNVDDRLVHPHKIMPKLPNPPGAIPAE